MAMSEEMKSTKEIINKAVYIRSGLLLLAALSATPALAGEGLFGWVYTLDIQPKGKFEFEQRVDKTVHQATGQYALTTYRSEIEYGLTDDIQIAGYVNSTTVHANKNYINPDVCSNGIPCTAGFGVPTSYNAGGENVDRWGGIDGYSFEVIWRILNPITSPVGVGIYFEPSVGKLQDDIEARLLLQSNFLDDKLIVASNLSFEAEKEKYTGEDIIRQSHVDLLYGVSYRFADNFSAGLEGRLHNDYKGYHLDDHIQFASFIGPNVHYAAKDFWVTAAWRYQMHGECYGDGMGDCNAITGKVSDDHGRNQFIVKVGIPF